MASSSGASLIQPEEPPVWCIQAWSVTAYEPILDTFIQRDRVAEWSRWWDVFLERPVDSNCSAQPSDSEAWPDPLGVRQATRALVPDFRDFPGATEPLPTESLPSVDRALTFLEFLDQLAACRTRSPWVLTLPNGTFYLARQDRDRPRSALASKALLTTAAFDMDTQFRIREWSLLLWQEYGHPYAWDTDPGIAELYKIVEQDDLTFPDFLGFLNEVQDLVGCDVEPKRPNLVGLSVAEMLRYARGDQKERTLVAQATGATCLTPADRPGYHVLRRHWEPMKLLPRTLGQRCHVIDCTESTHSQRVEWRTRRLHQVVREVERPGATSVTTVLEQMRLIVTGQLPEILIHRYSKTRVRVNPRNLEFDGIVYQVLEYLPPGRRPTAIYVGQPLTLDDLYARFHGVAWRYDKASRRRSRGPGWGSASVVVAAAVGSAHAAGAAVPGGGAGGAGVAAPPLPGAAPASPASDLADQGAGPAAAAAAAVVPQPTRTLGPLRYHFFSHVHGEHRVTFTITLVLPGSCAAGCSERIERGGAGRPRVFTG